MKKNTPQYMLLTHPETLYSYQLENSTYQGSIALTGSTNHQILADRFLVQFPDHLDFYDLSTKKLNSIQIDKNTVKIHKNRIYLFGEKEDVTIYDWDGEYFGSVDTEEWITANVAGNHIFVAYTSYIYIYDLDGTYLEKVNVQVQRPQFLENKFINLYDSGGVIHTWNDGEKKWEAAYFDAPPTDQWALVDGCLISVSGDSLNLFDLDGQPIAEDLNLYAEFKKEEVLFR